ncbi:MAG: hypothetical protein Q8R28_23855, partial [Dehalococcoidia bacterium]|nr:hypothetical protein [Dehalococcoidia bacterium]
MNTDRVEVMHRDQKPASHPQNPFTGYVTLRDRLLSHVEALTSESVVWVPEWDMGTTRYNVLMVRVPGDSGGQYHAFID